MYTLCVENKPLFFCPPRACLGAKAVVISTDAWIQRGRVYLDYFLEAFSVDLHNTAVGHAMPVILHSRTRSLLRYCLLL